jgi:hypothetical protein
MAKSRRGKAAKTLSSTNSTDERLAQAVGLLAQLVVHSMGDASQKKKALALRNVQLSNATIAELLNTSPEVISQFVYQARREGVGKRKKKQKKSITRRRR